MEDVIKSIMTRVFKAVSEQINAQTTPGNISGWDSVNHMKMMLEFEDRFGIEFSEKEIMQMVSYEEILKVLHSKVKTS